MMLQALIWDLSSIAQQQQPNQHNPAEVSAHLDPILAYNGGAEINQLQWSSAQPDWVAINFANKTQILRV